jgi:hypothetical protein
MVDRSKLKVSASNVQNSAIGNFPKNTERSRTKEAWVLKKNYKFNYFLFCCSMQNIQITVEFYRLQFFMFMLVHNDGQAAAKDFCGLKIYVIMKRQSLAQHHGLINYIGTKVKCCHLKK